MKILFDHLCFWERYGGVSKYFVELLSRIPKEERILSVHYTNQNEYISRLPESNVKSLFGNFSFRGKPRLVRDVGKIFSLPNILRSNYDIYHPTHYDTYALPFVPKKVKTVATIHDLNYFKIPQLYNRRSNRLAEQELQMAKKVDHIITISNNTKNDIIELWNIPEERISVIYHGIEHMQYQQKLPILHNRPYILYVGRRNEYKNFQALIKAFTRISQVHKEIDLVCTGFPFTENEKKQLSQFGILSRCYSYQASELQLNQLYQNAEVFVFPSFYEGFGMPILEAMSAKCPTVLANTSCFPEIAQDAAIYFDPYQSDDLAMALINVLESTDLRQNLIEKGNERVKDFSWDKCANQHLEVYKSLL